jgi:hypothetical protein
MAAVVKVVENGTVHIIVGPGLICECGITESGQARSCGDILQDMVNRHHSEYANGKVKADLEIEDSVPVPGEDSQNPLQGS